MIIACQVQQSVQHENANFVSRRMAKAPPILFRDIHGNRYIASERGFLDQRRER
jgi:hypothetical protein